MSLDNKFKYLLQTKTAIKEAIIGKGIEVSDTDTFRSYADKISSISSGSSGLSPAKMAGLCFWLDGEINSRAGMRNQAINGMQNLVWNALTGSSAAGYTEKLNGTPTFYEKGMKLGGTCFYPSYNFDDVTVEFAVEFGSLALEDGNNIHYILDSRSGATGFQVYTAEALAEGDMIVRFEGGNWAKNVTVRTKSKRFHCVITSKMSVANSTKIYLDGELANFSGGDAIATRKTANAPLSVGGTTESRMVSTTPTASNPWIAGAFYAPDDIFHLVRMWSRQLSEEEIKENYEEAKTRFNFN